jgi:hypothetical protein
MPARHILLMNVFLFAAITYFAVLTANDILSIRLAASKPIDVHIDDDSVAKTVRNPQDYRLVVRRDIFNSLPRAAAVQNSSVTSANQDLRIQLLGTSHVTGERAFAIVEDQDGDQALYREDDLIPGAGRIVDIARDSAIIVQSDRRIPIAISRTIGSGADAELVHSPGNSPPDGRFIPRLPRSVGNYHSSHRKARRPPSAPESANTSVRLMVAGGSLTNHV